MKASRQLINNPGSQEFLQHNYIRRHGRMTRAQSRALQELAGQYRITAQQIQTLAGTRPVGTPIGLPIGIEIGFGMGQALLAWATNEPGWQLFGVELYQPGIGALADGLHCAELENVRIVEQPAQQVLAALDEGVVSEIRIFFPDPWPKKRHFKRRLIQPEFVTMVARTLENGGRLRLATDWLEYAQWMRECLAHQPELELQLNNCRSAGTDILAGAGRATTKFERRGERLGHDIHDLVYIKHG